MLEPITSDLVTNTIPPISDREEVPSEKKSMWIRIREAAGILDVGESTLRHWLADGLVSGRCVKKFKGAWRFNRYILETEGIVLNKHRIRRLAEKSRKEKHDEKIVEMIAERKE